MREVAFVTGGSGGIGSACVTELARAGYSVAYTYNSNKEASDHLLGQLKKENLSAFAVKCDISDRADVKNAIKLAAHNVGNITHLVNNAAVAWEGLFTDMSDEDWNRIVSINMTGVFNCCQEVLPEMIRSHYGNIINISSMWGQTGASCEVAYSATKAGIIGLTKALAKETAPSGIRVNCIAPGVIRTHMLDCYTENDLEVLAQDTPLGRLGTPEDVAKTVLFLASGNSSFITGQILGINGGYVI